MGIGAFYRSVSAREEMENYRIEELLTDPDYFEWLKSFTNEHEGFNDGKWLNYNRDISDSDKKQINRLHLLYKGVHLWAEKNHIYPTLRGVVEFYIVKIGNVGYEIGMSAEYGLSYFCEQVKLKHGQRVIDFNDVINDEKLRTATLINQRLKILGGVIASLHELGVPLNVIKGKVEDMFEISMGHQKTKKDKR